MGYYIQVPQQQGKTKQLMDLHEAKIMNNPIWNEQDGIVCIVQNQTFEAIAFAFDEDEFNYFLSGKPTDKRQKIWLTMDKKLAQKLSGFSR